MTVEKIAISLPKSVAQRARRAVRKGAAPSVSAYVADALSEKLKLDELGELLEEMLAESGGPMTRSEQREMDRALGVQATMGPKATRRKR